MRSFVVVVLSFMFPGFGAAFVRKKRAMLAWFGVAMSALLAWLVSVWLMPVWFAIQLASAVDGLRRLRRAVRLGMPTDGGTALLAIGLYVVAITGLRTSVLATYQQNTSAMLPTLAIGDHVLVDRLSLYWHPIERGDLIAFDHPCVDLKYIKRVIALGGQTVEVRCSTVYVDGKPLPEQRIDKTSCSYDDTDDGVRWKTRECSEYTETSGARTYHLYYDPDRPERDARSAVQHSDHQDFPMLYRPEIPPSCAEVQGAGASSQQPGRLVTTRSVVGACEPQLHYVVPAGHVFVLGDSRSNSNDSRYWGSVPVDHIIGRVASIWLTAGRSGLSLRRAGAVE